MTATLYIAALLLVTVGLAHSYLGERYVLQRLERREGIPKLFGSSAGMIATLRFAWHITTVAWWGIAALLVMMANPPLASAQAGAVISATFFVHFLIALIGSKGKHLSWIVFLAIALLVFLGTRG